MDRDEDGRRLAPDRASAADRHAAARRHLTTADPVMARLIAARPGFDPDAWLASLPPMDAFGVLIFQVAGQQLSVKVTRTLLERLRALFGGELPSPEALLAADPAAIRAAGLSNRKVATLRAVAERFADGRLSRDALAAMSDDEVIATLTDIPGIGRWTAQGFLVIALGRGDVVLTGDLVLRKAVQRAYGLDHIPSEEEVAAIAEPWRPYRTLAADYLFALTEGDTPSDAPDAAAAGTATAGRVGRAAARTRG